MRKHNYYLNRENCICLVFLIKWKETRESNPKAAQEQTYCANRKRSPRLLIVGCCDGIITRILMHM